MNYRLVYTKRAKQDAKKVLGSHLSNKTREFLCILEENPFQVPPPFEALRGDLTGALSRRTNIQHRLVYQVLQEEHVVKVIRMWTH